MIAISEQILASVMPLSVSPRSKSSPAPVPEPVDILILSNGPGELSTWVRPVVQQLQAQLREPLGGDRDQVRISLVLAPCPNATGEEPSIAARYPEIDRIQGADQFFPFLLWGQTAANWQWRSRGLVIFLGGDQLFPIIIGKRLGYKTLIYAEWEARWWRWADHFAVMQAKVSESVPPQWHPKFTVVGDLMADVSSTHTPDTFATTSEQSPLQIGLLPGSKAAQLRIGVPFFLAVADHVRQAFPHATFLLPVAPTLAPEDLVTYAQRERNEYIPIFQGQTATLERTNLELMLTTAAGTGVKLCTDFPAYQQLSQCQLCVTTIGANTAELGTLGVPMLVILPTQQADVMRAWDGIPGLLVNLPVVGRWIALRINEQLLQRMGLLAWPNIWAGREIVPELVGRIFPTEVAEQVGQYLDHPERLTAMRQDLRSVRGEAGAAAKLVAIAQDLLAA
ncbi:MAG: lipid-A-disaccharide synthase [Cyanobacteria bacterium P01_H01_bin.121]